MGGVELAKLGVSVKLSSCIEMRRRIFVEVSWLSGCSCWYDSTTNAVRTAENRPAYVEVGTLLYMLRETYKDEQIIHILHMTLHRRLILLLHLGLDRGP